MIEKKILKGFIAKGLSILPLKADKRPNISSWKQYQSSFINIEENAHLFEGLGLICGEISGGLEVVDVDQKNEIYVEGEGHLIDKLKAKIELLNGKSITLVRYPSIFTSKCFSSLFVIT